jgi:hypothetical protein
MFFKEVISLYYENPKQISKLHCLGNMKRFIVKVEGKVSIYSFKQIIQNSHNHLCPLLLEALAKRKFNF